jgi:hypothetical protein
MTVFAVILPLVLSGQEEKPKYVTLIKNRKATLELADEILDSEDSTIKERIGKTRNPFKIYVEPKVYKARPSVVSGPAPAPVAAKRLPDEIVVKAVADQINPTGAVVISSKGILMFANGGRLSVGATVPAKIRGETYNVVVSKITADDFTLKLNDAEYTKSISKGSVTID